MLDTGNESVGYISGLKRLMKGRYSVAYVLMQSLRQYCMETPEQVLEDIQRAGDGSDARQKVALGGLDIRVTVGTEEDLAKGDRLSVRQKAVCCGSFALSDAGTRGCEVYSIWFAKNPEPSRKGCVDRYRVLTAVMGDGSEPPVEQMVNVVVVNRDPERGPAFRGSSRLSRSP